jgi:hypothetical protein
VLKKRVNGCGADRLVVDQAVSVEEAPHGDPRRRLITMSRRMRV